MNITINSVTKRYQTVTAVDNISLTVQSGQIHALLGPNGAGKSSLVRMLVGLTQPDSGSITITDNAGQPVELKPEHFAYLPEDRGLYQDRTITDNLSFIAKLRGLSPAVYKERIAKWLEHFELTDRASEPMRQLSKGNQQKVQLIATLLHDPDLVILDEPFSGLDPVNQEHVLNVLRQLREEGKTVLLSAHQMALVERLADKMLLMSHGKALAQGTLDDIRDTLQPQRIYRIQCDAHKAEQEWHGHTVIQSITKLSDQEVEIIVAADSNVSALWPVLSEQLPIESFAPHKLDLHDLYLNTIRGSNSAEEQR